MIAIVGAVLLAVALLVPLAQLSLGPLDVAFFEVAGLLALALHFARNGATRRIGWR